VRRLTALSEFGVKGPAAFLLEIDRRRLLLDLGEGPDGRARPDVSGIGRVDAILVSHGHADHAGALDLAASLGEPPVFATAPVRKLAACARLAQAQPLARGSSKVLGIPVETGPAGHAPGAVWMRIGGADGLLYTGDCSAESVLYPWEPPPPAAALLFDASYGTFDAPLDEAVEAIGALAAQKPVILPAPAAGRGLEMALLLSEAGLAVAACAAHCRTAETLLGCADWLTAGAEARLHRFLERCRPIEPDAPLPPVTIAAKPNADDGEAEGLVRRWAGSEAAAVVFTRHLAAGSPAEEAVAEGKARFIRWNVHPRLSDLRRLLERVRPRAAMPAFVEPKGRRALSKALAPWPIKESPWMEW